MKKLRLFSERNGLVDPSDVLIRNQMPIEVQNAIANCFTRLANSISSASYNGRYDYECFELYLWTDFSNLLESDFCDEYGNFHHTSMELICDRTKEWNVKLDLIEFSIQYLKEISHLYQVYNSFIEDINYQFLRVNFAYRIVDDLVVELTTEEEIQSIQQALQESTVNIKNHLSKALQLYSRRPVGDYSNSIKESISAIEAYCREKTGENTLGGALKAFQKMGVKLHPIFTDAITKLYAYTNQQDTGIRHALMDSSSEYSPTAAEALYMVVSSSALINYLNNKIG